MADQINGVSAAIGALQAQVVTLTKATESAEQSRSAMHEKINSIGQTNTEISAILNNIAQSVETLSATVKSHENLRQQASGARLVITSVLSALGVIGAWKGIEHFFLK